MMRDALKNLYGYLYSFDPGKPAPRILNEELVNLMKPGSIIYDLAAEQGGNSAFSEAGKINNVNKIKVIGVKSLMNRLPLLHQVCMQKIYLVLLGTCIVRIKSFNINLEDEIINKTL